MDLVVVIFFVALFVLFGFLIYLDYKKIDNDKKLIKKEEYDKLINFIKKISSYLKSCIKKIVDLSKNIFSKVKKIYSKILHSKAIKLLIGQYQKAEENIKKLKNNKIRNEAIEIIAKTKKAMSVLDDDLSLISYIRQKEEIIELVNKLEDDLKMDDIQKISESKENLRYLITSLDIFGYANWLKKSIKKEAHKFILKTEKALKILTNDTNKHKERTIENLIYNLEVALASNDLKEIRKSKADLEEQVKDLNIFTDAERVNNLNIKKRSSNKIEKDFSSINIIDLILFIIFLICIFTVLSYSDVSGEINSGQYVGSIIIGYSSLMVFFMRLAYRLNSNIGITILLGIVTFGMYFIVWDYQLAKSIVVLTKNEKNPLFEFILILFVPFYNLIWLYESSKALSRQYGEKVKDQSTLYLILSIFCLNIISLALLQSDINLIIQSNENILNN